MTNYQHLRVKSEKSELILRFPNSIKLFELFNLGNGYSLSIKILVKNSKIYHRRIELFNDN